MVTSLVSRNHEKRTTFLIAPLPGQVTALPFNPVAADYSRTLDRLILISGNPTTLHVYDPAPQKDSTVSLVQPPLSLSLSPDGLHGRLVTMH